jgi:hypothetical protein
MKIYCDQMNSNIRTQFVTEHLLTLQDFLHVCCIPVINTGISVAEW